MWCLGSWSPGSAIKIAIQSHGYFLNKKQGKLCNTVVFFFYQLWVKKEGAKYIGSPVTTSKSKSFWVSKKDKSDLEKPTTMLLAKMVGELANWVLMLIEYSSKPEDWE